MKLTAYISGPITGLPNNNYEAFETAQECLEALGYNVINPHKLEVKLDNELRIFLTEKEWKEYEWRSYMNACMPAVGKSHVVYMLHGWKESRGAKMERNAAIEYGIAVLDFGEIMNPVVLEQNYNVLNVEWL